MVSNGMQIGVSWLSHVSDPPLNPSLSGFGNGVTLSHLFKRSETDVDRFTSQVYFILRVALLKGIICASG